MKELLSKNNIDYIEMDITENLFFLKKFLKFRDNSPAFDAVKEKGSIGLPCIIVNDGEKILFSLDNISLDELK